MRTSTIRHPENEKLIIVRQWQIEYCDGDRVAASLLSFLEYWHNIKADMSIKNRQSNQIAANHGDEGQQDISTLQFHTETELVEGILGFGKRDSVRAALSLLEEKGAIGIFKNPNPRYAFDKTRYIQFYPEGINEWLSRVYDHRSSENRLSLSKNRQRSSENQSRSSKNQRPLSEITSAITEITSKITSKITPNTNTEGTSPVRGKKIEEEEDDEPIELGEEDFTDIENQSSLVKEKESRAKPDSNHEDKKDAPPAHEVETTTTKAKTKRNAEYMEMYNANKPASWAVCKGINEQRSNAIAALIKERKSEATEAFLDALKFINHDSWWCNDCGNRNIDTLLRRGKVTTLQENYLAIAPKAAHPSATPSNLSVNPSVFESWEEHQHSITYRTQYAKSATLEEFYSKSKINAAWLEYAIAKYPDWKWNLT